MLGVKLAIPCLKNLEKKNLSPANIPLDEDVFRLRLRKTSSRSLQDVLIKANMFASALRVQKTSSRRLQDVLVKTNIFVLAIRLQDVFKTFSRCLQDVLLKGLQDIFKTSSRRFEDVFKTSSKRLKDVLRNVFKTYHQVKLFLLTTSLRSIQHVSETYFSKETIYGGICPGNTTSDKFMVSVQNLQER